MNQIMNIKTTIILLLNITLISLSYLYKDITPIAIIVLALYSFYLSLKLEEYKNICDNLNLEYLQLPATHLYRGWRKARALKREPFYSPIY